MAHEHEVAGIEPPQAVTITIALSCQVTAKRPAFRFRGAAVGLRVVGTTIIPTIHCRDHFPVRCRQHGHPVIHGSNIDIGAIMTGVRRSTALECPSLPVDIGIPQKKALSEAVDTRVTANWPGEQPFGRDDPGRQKQQ
jgi:hypothetical protein